MAIDTPQLLGETIREIRNQRGLTQQQLADLSRMERTYIVALENGRKNPSGRTLVLIAGALGILPGELFRRFTKKVMKALKDEQPNG